MHAQGLSYTKESRMAELDLDKNSHTFKSPALEILWRQNNYFYLENICDLYIAHISQLNM